MSRRRSSSQPFSLFAFQDIIMAITAIVILVTMIMTIELVNRANQLPKDASTVDQDLIDKIQNSNNELETIIQSLAIQIEKAQEGINIPTPVIIDDVKEFQRERLA